MDGDQMNSPQVKSTRKKNRARFLVISDVHMAESVLYMVEQRVNEHTPDAIIICGDITHFGPPEWGMRFLNALPDLPIFAVHGNCDPVAVLQAIDESKATNLHGQRPGSRPGERPGANAMPFPNMTIHDPTEYEEWLEKIVSGADILVTHAPSYGHVDSARRGLHTGSEELAAAIKENNIILALSGHIHESRGIEQEGGTLFVNPGKAGDGFAALVDIYLGEEIQLFLTLVDITGLGFYLPPFQRVLFKYRLCYLSYLWGHKHASDRSVLIFSSII